MYISEARLENTLTMASPSYGIDIICNKVFMYMSTNAADCTLVDPDLIIM